ncbi:hypothetical protein ACJJTC_008714 [Scirpophaga incertulas]
MQWSNEKIQLFIELYEEEPVIWNPKDPGHKSRNNVHDAWTKIKTKFCEGTGESISVEELKKKKENLMATYRKLNTKVKLSSTSGVATDGSAGVGSCYPASFKRAGLRPYLAEPHLHGRLGSRRIGLARVV